MRLSTYGKVNLIATYYFLVGGSLLILAFAILILPASAALLDQSEFLARLPGWFLGLVVMGRSVWRGRRGVPGDGMGAVADQAMGAAVGQIA